MIDKIKNYIDSHEIVKIGWYVFLLLVLSRMFYIFIMSAYQDVNGVDTPLANLFYQSDSEHYIQIAEGGYSEFTENGKYENWAFFPLYPMVIRLAHYCLPMLSMVAVGIIVSNIFMWVAGIYLVCYLRKIIPGTSGYFAVFLMFFGPYTYFFACVYTETLYVMLLAMFFYYLHEKNYCVASMLAVLAGTTRIAGVLLVFPLVLQMFLDDFSGRFKFRNFGEFIVETICNPIRLVEILICPAGAFFNMYHLHRTMGDVWAFQHVQIAWRTQTKDSMLSIMKNALAGEEHGQRWAALALLVVVGFYLYMLYKKHYSQVLFGFLAILVPLSGGLMSMCRFITGSYIIFPGMGEYLEGKPQAKAIVAALAVFVEGVLIWIWAAMNSSWFVV